MSSDSISSRFRLNEVQSVWHLEKKRNLHRICLGKRQSSRNIIAIYISSLDDAVKEVNTLVESLISIGFQLDHYLGIEDEEYLLDRSTVSLFFLFVKSSKM